MKNLAICLLSMATINAQASVIVSCFKVAEDVNAEVKKVEVAVEAMAPNGKATLKFDRHPYEYTLKAKLNADETVSYKMYRSFYTAANATPKKISKKNVPMYNDVEFDFGYDNDQDFKYVTCTSEEI